MARVALALAILGAAASALAAEPRLRSLVIPGHRRAVVVEPTAAGPRPVVVLLHGNSDRPEWLCRHLAELVDGRAWMICTAGIVREGLPTGADRWTYGPASQVADEVNGALRALQLGQPGRVAAGPVLLVGFSLGAGLAATLARADPARFARLLLHEGGRNGWTSRKLAAFVRGGGERLLVACGGPRCARSARRVCSFAKQRRKGGKPICAVVTVGGLGHAYTGGFVSGVRSAFDGLIDGDDRWLAARPESVSPARAVTATTR